MNQIRRIVMLHKKKLLWFFGLVLIVFASLWLYSFIASRTVVTIKSSQDSIIYVSEEKGGNFTQIGENGSATYVTRSAGDYFFKAESGNDTTVGGLRIKTGSEYSMELPIGETVSAEKVFESSIKDPYIKGSAIQGVEPASSSMVNFNLAKEEFPRVEFIGLPYIRNIAWLDKDNFAYSSFREGVGLFLDGKDTKKDRIASRIISNDLPTPEYNFFFSNATKYKNKPLILLGADGVYKSADMGVSLEKIVHQQPITLEQIFSDSTYVYVNIESRPSEFASETEEPVDANSQELATNTTDVYTYDGEFVLTAEASGAKIASVNSVNDSIVLLGEFDVLTVNTDGVIDEKPSYFELHRDMIKYNDKLFVLTENGLWSLDSNLSVFQLIFEFGDRGIGQTESLTLDKDETYVYFSINKDPQVEDSAASTYRVRTTDLTL